MDLILAGEVQARHITLSTLQWRTLMDKSTYVEDEGIKFLRRRIISIFEEHNKWL
jgi:hypothetical protein